MLLHDVWDYLVIGLCLVGFTLGWLALRAESAIALNRLLAAYSILLAAAVLSEVVAANARLAFGLFVFRLSHFFAAGSFIAGALMHDAVDHPESRLPSRLRREWAFCGLGAFLALLPCTPLWHPVELGRKFSGMSFHRVVFESYLGLRLVLVAWLAGICIIAYRRSAPQRRFDNQVMLFLSLYAVLACTVLFFVRVFRLHQAVHWVQLVAPAYFPMQLWMMTGRQTESLRRLGTAAAGLCFGIAFAVVLIFPLLGFAGRTTTLWMGLALVITAYAALLGAQLLWRRFAGDSESATKAKLTELIAAAVSAESLGDGFCRLVESYVGTCVAELAFFEGTASDSLTASTPPSLALVNRRGDRTAVLFVKRQSTLKLITPSTIRCLRELLATVQVARERLMLARKAIHNDRLASVGFVASQISHQARNRLDPIRSALELLREGREGELTREHRELLFQEMESFLVDFNVALEMARADLGRIAPCNIGDTVAEALDIFRIYAARRGIAIETAFEPVTAPIWADRQLIRQTLFNLLRNAAEALEGIDGPRIAVGCRSREDRLEIDVWDNGPGVPAEVHDRLFSDFATSKEGGTGIGLSLCRSAMALMNGSVDYLTPKGSQNAHFRVTVPLGGTTAPAI